MVTREGRVLSREGRKRRRAHAAALPVEPEAVTAWALDQWVRADLQAHQDRRM